MIALAVAGALLVAALLLAMLERRDSGGDPVTGTTGPRTNSYVGRLGPVYRRAVVRLTYAGAAAAFIIWVVLLALQHSTGSGSGGGSGGDTTKTDTTIHVEPPPEPRPEIFVPRKNRFVTLVKAVLRRLQLPPNTWITVDGKTEPRGILLFQVGETVPARARCQNVSNARITGEVRWRIGNGPVQSSLDPEEAFTVPTNLPPATDVAEFTVKAEFPVTYGEGRTMTGKGAQPIRIWRRGPPTISIRGSGIFVVIVTPQSSQLQDRQREYQVWSADGTLDLRRVVWTIAGNEFRLSHADERGRVVGDRVTVESASEAGSTSRLIATYTGTDRQEIRATLELRTVAVRGDRPPPPPPPRDILELTVTPSERVGPKRPDGSFDINVTATTTPQSGTVTITWSGPPQKQARALAQSGQSPSTGRTSKRTLIVLLQPRRNAEPWDVPLTVTASWVPRANAPPIEASKTVHVIIAPESGPINRVPDDDTAVRPEQDHSPPPPPPTLCRGVIQSALFAGVVAKSTRGRTEAGRCRELGGSPGTWVITLDNDSSVTINESGIVHWPAAVYSGALPVDVVCAELKRRFIDR